MKKQEQEVPDKRQLCFSTTLMGQQIISKVGSIFLFWIENLQSDIYQI